MNDLSKDPLFQEVNAAVQRDQMMAMWKQYRKPIITAAVVLVLFTMGFTQWRKYQETQAGVALEQFSAAEYLYSQTKYDDAATAFAKIAAHANSAEISDMAHLWQARALTQADKKTEAVTVLTGLAEHPKSTQKIWRDLACLRLVALDAAKTGCLNDTSESPLAAERTMVQAAQLWEAGKNDEARALLSALAMNPTTPPIPRERAQHYLSVLPAAAPISEVKK